MMPTVRMGAVGAKPFGVSPTYPGDIASLFVWYEVDQSIPGGVEGAQQTKLTNLTSGGYDIYQTTTSRQPVYRASAVNGFPALEFDGTDDYMNTALPTGSANLFKGEDKPFTGIMVLKSDLVTLSPTYFSLATGNGYAVHAVGQDASSGLSRYASLRISDTFVGSTLTGSLVSTSWRLLVTQFNGTTVRLWLDGGAPNVKGTLNTGSLTVDRLMLGASRVNGTLTGYFDGQIAMLAIYQRKLTASEINELGRTYSNKYGLPWTNVSDAL